MNSVFAAGLFDGQWVIVVIIVVGALINWLSKRRAEQADESTEGGEPSPSSDKPAREFNLEEAMRRLLGEDPPPQSPAPPPIPPAARGESPPLPTWREEKPLQRVEQTVPPERPPPIAEAHADVTATAVGEQQKQAARRFEQLNGQGRHPATVVGHRRGYRLSAGKRPASPWRDPRSARRAFVASLVFAPPKGLET